MNKIIALFVALAVFSSAALFAAPVSGAPGAAPDSQTEESFEVNALFADVDATQLSDTEAETVEGGLIAGAIGLGLVGSGFGGYVGLEIGAMVGNPNGGMQVGAVIGTVIGGIVGAFSPW